MARSNPPYTTTWTACNGVMVFILPNCQQHQVDAHQVDHPMTMCEVLDTAFTKLTPVERSALVHMLQQLQEAEHATQDTDR